MDWRWKNFGKHEIYCRGTKCGCNHELWDKNKYGEDMPDYFPKSMDKLQALRDDWGQPLVLNSGHRCVKHNADPSVGGGTHSQHLKLAFDVRMPKHKQVEFVEMARRHGFNAVGWYQNFIHIDARPDKAEWFD